MLPGAVFDPQLRKLLSRAVARAGSEMARDAPDMAAEVCLWMKALAGTGPAEEYFQEGRATIFLLPWFLEKSLRPAPDPEFQSGLVYSSVNAYYYVRLIDNLQDGQYGKDRQDVPELRLLPALGFFHAQFQSPYQRYFPSDSPFWKFFHSTWVSMAEATFKDATTPNFSAAEFTAFAARKSAGVKIPLAAVCFRYDRTDLLDRWCSFYDRLACWNQMLNDLLGWQKDSSGGISTFLLSEARRSKRSRESETGWMVRRGFAWACGLLRSWMQELQTLASALHSSDLEAYLRYREREITNWQKTLSPDLVRLARLANLLERTPAKGARFPQVPPEKEKNGKKKSKPNGVRRRTIPH